MRNWVDQARADRTHGKTGLTTAEREALARLRKENRILQEEREISKKGGLLREGAAVRFRFIAAEKAHHSVKLDAGAQVLRCSTQAPEHASNLRTGLGSGPWRRRGRGYQFLSVGQDNGQDPPDGLAVLDRLNRHRDLISGFERCP